MAMIMVVLVLLVVSFGLDGKLNCYCLDVHGIWPGCHSGLCLAYGPYRLMASPPDLSLCRMASLYCTKSGGNSELSLANWSFFVVSICVLLYVNM